MTLPTNISSTTVACIAIASLAALLPVTALSGQNPETTLELCVDAERHLVEREGMVAITGPDTIDDWRSQTRVAGCRITAAAVTRRTFGYEARRFFERIREAEWVRTPEPRDAPNESSLRFRKGAADCLFNFYGPGMLNTEAELAVDDQVVPGPGERRYHFLVLCLPVMNAAPRG